MKIIATDKSEQNQAAVDPWTIVHFAAGLAMGLMNVPIRSAFGASFVYELAEQVFERMEVGQEVFETSGPESVSNAVVDMVVFGAGHWAGRRWNESGEATGSR